MSKISVKEPNYSKDKDKGPLKHW